MTAVQELEEELESHAVHVGHGQNGDDAVATTDNFTQHVVGEVVVRPQGAIGNHFTQHVVGEVVVRPQGAIGNHDALGETCRSAGVVNHGHLFAIGFLVVVDVFLAEVFGELLAVELVEVLAGVGQLVGATNHQ